MWLGIIYIGVPVVTYLVLAGLPRGAWALAAFLMTALLLGAIWVAYGLRLPPLFTGDGRIDVYPLAALTFTSAAWLLAIVTRILRRAAAGTRRLAGWALIIGIGLLFGLPALYLLGI